MKNSRTFHKILTITFFLSSFCEARGGVEFKCGNHDPADIANSPEEARQLSKTKGCKNWDVISTTGALTDQQKWQWLAKIGENTQFKMATDLLMGDWKLDLTKSALASGVVRSGRVAYEPAMFGKLKVTAEGADPKGKAFHTEWTGKFDGEDYAILGDPTEDTRSYFVLDDRTIGFLAKKDGKVTASGKIILSPDGKNRTVKTDAVAPNGKKVKSLSVYNKE